MDPIGIISPFLFFVEIVKQTVIRKKNRFMNQSKKDI